MELLKLFNNRSSLRALHMDNGHIITGRKKQNSLTIWVSNFFDKHCNTEGYPLNDARWQLQKKTYMTFIPFFGFSFIVMFIAIITDMY